MNRLYLSALAGLMSLTVSGCKGCAKKKDKNNEMKDPDIILPVNDDSCPKIILENGRYEGFVQGNFGTYIIIEEQGLKQCAYITVYDTIEGFQLPIAVLDDNCDKKAEYLVFKGSEERLYERTELAPKIGMTLDSLLERGQKLACEANLVEAYDKVPGKKNPIQL
ncbi:MAG: hypothetical protein ABIG52_02875 [Nanoarchaeota archaeon]|nr:hypothetical protein [Nanoarchaeota archaeon]MBU1643751.1 hypothetical protein [Nanoarchaeota archaeon]